MKCSVSDRWASFLLFVRVVLPDECLGVRVRRRPRGLRSDAGKTPAVPTLIVQNDRVWSRVARRATASDPAEIDRISRRHGLMARDVPNFRNCAERMESAKLRWRTLTFAKGETMSD